MGPSRIGDGPRELYKEAPEMKTKSEMRSIGSYQDASTSTEMYPTCSLKCARESAHTRVQSTSVSEIILRRHREV